MPLQLCIGLATYFEPKDSTFVFFVGPTHLSAKEIKTDPSRMDKVWLQINLVIV